MIFNGFQWSPLCNDFPCFHSCSMLFIGCTVQYLPVSLNVFQWYRFVSWWVSSVCCNLYTGLHCLLVFLQYFSKICNDFIVFSMDFIACHIICLWFECISLRFHDIFLKFQMNWFQFSLDLHFIISFSLFFIPPWPSRSSTVHSCSICMSPLAMPRKDYKEPYKRHTRFHTILIWFHCIFFWCHCIFIWFPFCNCIGFH